MARAVFRHVSVPHDPRAGGHDDCEELRPAGFDPFDPVRDIESSLFGAARADKDPPASRDDLGEQLMSRLAGHRLHMLRHAGNRRQERLEEARRWLAEQDGDEGWLEEEDEEALRLLVLVHRMAATRLGFPNLYSALNDKSPEELSSGLIDGTAWVVRPFLSYVLPAVLARHEGREFEIMRLLRKHCPRLQPDALAVVDTAGLLNSLQGQIGELVGMLQNGSGARVGDVVRFMKNNNLITFDDRYVELVDLYADTAEPVSEPATDNAALRFMQCNASELWGYRKYIEKMSPFATQQGIKGAEFDKVIVVIDDEEGRTNTFSYGKYFDVTPLSERDCANMAAGKDSVVDRTRRLFYVCCSRALSDLAVIIFAENTVQIFDAVKSKGFFSGESLYVFD